MDDPDATAHTEAKKPGRARRDISLKSRALAYLSRREYSRVELARKLASWTDDADALQALLDDLERQQWLSDARYTQSVIHRKAPRQGTARILHALREQGVDADTVTPWLTQLRDTEQERARAVWQKKFGTPPADAKAYLRQQRFMAYRGFAPQVLRQILTHTHVDED